MNYKWNDASSYEAYIGRWSRLVTPEFLKWINQSNNLTWLDVGCGTGALSEAILKFNNPAKLIGIDPSESHINYAKEHFDSQTNSSFMVSDAANIPLEDNDVDIVAAGLVLNFIDDLKHALAEFSRVCKQYGMICGYVWDYASKMEMIRCFWDSAVSLFDNAREKVEAFRFDTCNPDVLKQYFNAAGFSSVEITFIDIPTTFKNFDDYWKPFLSGTGPAPGYCMSLSEADREKLKQKIYESLPVQKDGSIHLIARAIAVKAINRK